MPGSFFFVETTGWVSRGWSIRYPVFMLKKNSNMPHLRRVGETQRRRSQSAGFGASGKARLVLVGAILAALAAVALALGTCTASRSVSDYVPSSSSPYDWNNLRNDNGRLAYEDESGVTSRTGIDVSEHQGYIDWNVVAQDGIDFAMIRLGNRGATSGGLSVDDYFAYNLSSAQAAGLDVGVYFFSQATTEQEAVEEAEFVLSNLDGAALDYPIAYDHERIAGVEGRADDLSVEQMTANARAFCERIQQAGYAAMIYGNASDLARYDLDGLRDYAVWYAEYGVRVPTSDVLFTMWQYSNEGTVAGIETVVDLNIHFVGQE